MKQQYLQRLVWAFCIITSGALLVGMPVLSVTEAATEPSVYEEEAVVVTATRTQQAEQKAPGKTEVITKEDIALSGAATVADVLMNSGITLSSNGGAAGKTMVQLDGGNEKQTLLLINGVPVNAGTNGWIDLSYFPTAGIGASKLRMDRCQRYTEPTL